MLLLIILIEFPHNLTFLPDFDYLDDLIQIYKIGQFIFTKILFFLNYMDKFSCADNNKLRINTFFEIKKLYHVFFFKLSGFYCRSTRQYLSNFTQRLQEQTIRCFKQ